MCEYVWLPMVVRRTEFLGKFGKTKSDYAYCESLTKREWAWEFLRRNKDYRIDVKTNRIRFTKPVKHPSGITLYRPRGNHSPARKWGLSVFADPNLPANKTHIFWRPKLMPNAISAKALPYKEHPDLDLFSTPSCIAILQGNGTQKLLIRTPECILDVTFIGANPLFENVDLEFRVRGFQHLKPQLNALFLLEKALNIAADDTPNGKIKRLVSTNLRGLIALDCQDQSGSLQDTANVFRAFGMTRLSWSTVGDESLKKQIIRARKKGIGIMQSGYKNLL